MGRVIENIPELVFGTLPRETREIPFGGILLKIQFLL